jgi:TonB family protein
MFARWLAAALLLLACASAHADLGAAFKAYDSGRHAEAYEEFRALAALGSPLAQLNAGMMLVNGEGVKPDPVIGYGWMLAARDNGSGQAGEVIKQIEKRFTLEQSAAAQAHAARYGREGTRNRLVPRVAQSAGQTTPPTTDNLRLAFPDKARAEGTMGYVHTLLIVGSDGAVRDVSLVAAQPENMFEGSALSGMRRWHFAPATHDGAVVAIGALHVVSFGIDGKDGKALPRLVKLLDERRATAAQGSAAAQYQLAELLMRFPELQREDGEALRSLEKAAERGYPPAQRRLGTCRLSGGCSGSPGEGVDLLLRAAQSGDLIAQLMLGILSISESSGEGDARAREWLEAAVAAGSRHSRKYLAAVLAASVNESVRDPSRVAKLVEPLTLVRGYAGDPDVWQVQAAASAARGDYATAVSLQRKAVDLAEKLAWEPARLRERLASYQKNTPWYGDLFDLKELKWVAGALAKNQEIESCEEAPAAGSRITRCEDSGGY